MDKLKENGFAIGVGALVVLLLAFLWFWALAPVFSDIPSYESELGSLKTQMSAYLKRDFKLSKKYVEEREGHRKELERAIANAVDFYAQEKAAPFSEFLAPYDENSDPGSFDVALETAVTNLKKAYLEKYPRPEPDPDERRRDDKDQDLVVFRIPVNVPEDVKLAMKHYWIISEVFRAAEENEIGGLRAIRFKTKESKEDLPTPATYNPIRASVEVDLLPAKLTPFLQSLFESKRVPFVDVESLQMRRDTSKAIEKLVIEKIYPRADARAQEKPKLMEGLEPAVHATVRLVALDWTGLKKAESPGETRGRRGRSSRSRRKK